MISADDINFGLGGPPAKRELVLWGSAALIVLAVHAGGGWYLSRTLDVQQQPEAAEEAMMVDLTPMLDGHVRTPDVPTSPLGVDVILCSTRLISGTARRPARACSTSKSTSSPHGRSR